MIDNNKKLELGFGTVAITTLSSKKKVFNLLDSVLNADITHFDTAPIYGNSYSERLLGQFIRSNRSNISIGSKFGLQPNVKWNLPTDLALRLNYLKNKIRRKNNFKSSSKTSAPIIYREISKEYIMSSLEGSLNRLKTDHLDLLLLHEILPNFLTMGALEYLFELKKNNIIDKVGIGISSNNMFMLHNQNLENFDVLQYDFSNDDSAKENIDRWKNKIHIFHSLFKGLPSTETAREHEDLIIKKIRRCQQLNPVGMLLFSSSKIHHVEQNAKLFQHAIGND